MPLQEKGKALRKGLTLEEMNAEQKEQAKELLKSGTSAGGFTKASTIMSLELILRELEKNGANVRNPEWYFFTVFGTPGKTGNWGWRVEGHHLSLNFTFKDGKLVSSTPAFFGANPAVVLAGDKKGLRTLPEAEDNARDLFASLDDDQRKAASQPKQFPEIEQAKPKPNVGDPVGLPAAKMNDKQRDILTKLVEGYADRMPPDVAKAELKEVKQVKDGGEGEDSFPSWGLALIAGTEVHVLSRQPIDKSDWLGPIIAKWAGVEFEPAKVRKCETM